MTTEANWMVIGRTDAMTITEAKLMQIAESLLGNPGPEIPEILQALNLAYDLGKQDQINYCASIGCMACGQKVKRG